MRLTSGLCTAALAALALIAALPAHAGGLVACRYAPAESHQVTEHPACATLLPGGALRLRPDDLDDLRFEENGLAVVYAGPLAYYVGRDGRSAPVPVVDDQAVAFHEGLAPSPRLVGGRYKIGYIDQDLRLVIPPRYDGGLDFNEGRAEVCRGCHVARDGDFAELHGGVWGCIDTHGREVVPLTHATPDDLDCAGD